VDAIVLLTGKFDRNLVYRQKLAETGNMDPDTLDAYVAMISITIPVVTGTRLFV
jgi:hypothetical protein